MGVKVSSTLANGHFRLGMHFPFAGRILAEDHFTDEEWPRIDADPRLVLRRVGEEPEDEEPDDDGLDAAELEEKVAETIRSLTQDDFTQAGLPDLKAIRTLLETDAERAAVDSKMREKVWAALVAEGFEVPTAPPQE